MAGEAKQHAPYNWVKGQGPNIPAPPPSIFYLGPWVFEAKLEIENRVKLPL